MARVARPAKIDTAKPRRSGRPSAPPTPITASSGSGTDKMKTRQRAPDTDLRNGLEETDDSEDEDGEPDTPVMPQKRKRGKTSEAITPKVEGGRAPQRARGKRAASKSNGETSDEMEIGRSAVKQPKQKPMAGRKKKASNAIVTEEDDFVRPPEAEFSNTKVYVPYRSFELDLPSLELTKEEKTFSRGEFVFVRPGGVIGRPLSSTKPKPKSKPKSKAIPKTHEGSNDSSSSSSSSSSEEEEEKDVWLAQIDKIRAKSADDVWLNIKWLYTTKQQLVGESCTNIPSVIARHEVFVCDSHEDVINAQTVDGHVKVLRFDDTKPISEHIGRHDYWYRSEFVLKSGSVGRKAKGPHIQPIDEVGNSHCPVCDKGYFPVPKTATSKSTQVFCASSECGTWTHVACLPEPKELTPDALSQLEITGLDEEGRPNLHLWTEDEDEQQMWEEMLEQQHAGASLETLMAHARSSIFRGEEHGTEGNGLEVLAARAELWKRKNKGEDVSEIESRWEDLDFRTCPTCKGVL